jgi:hypothetical protein
LRNRTCCTKLDASLAAIVSEIVSDSRFTSGTFDFGCGCLIVEDGGGSNVELVVGDGANDMLDTAEDGGGKALGVRTDIMVRAITW